MSDSLACFTYLVENAPAWIKSLDELHARIQKRQAEVARVAVPVAQRGVKKSSSNESIRLSGPDTTTPSSDRDVTAAPLALDSQQTTITATEPILGTPSRKRKTASLISAATGIHKYRSRATVAVYYDSEVQDAFDKLVRSISTGRNNIRKSRMADRITTMMSVHDKAQSAMPGVGGPLPGRSPILRTVRSASGMPKFDAYLQEGLRSRQGVGLRPPPFAQPNLAEIKSDTAVQKHDARQEADAALDKAQGFCEQGAHQFLRDGDCGEEISGAKAAFQDVLRISVEELERLNKDAKAAAITEAEVAAIKEKELEKSRQDASKQELDGDLRQESGINQHPALMHSAGVIEADDEEDGSDDDYDNPSLLPSPPFRLMART
jgi:hypothetical protein